MSARNLIQIPAEFQEIAAVLPISNRGPQNGMTVNGRELHAAAKIGTPYSMWIKRAVEHAELVEGRDYFTASQIREAVEGARGAKHTEEFYLTVTAAKEIILMSRSPLGKLTRRYLIWAEESAREQSPSLPQQFIATQPANTFTVEVQGALQMLAQGTLATASRLQLLETNLESQSLNTQITPAQQDAILDAISAKFVELGINEQHNFNAWNPAWNAAYPIMYPLNDLKVAFFGDRFGRKTYKDLAQKDFATAIAFIERWTPNDVAAKKLKKAKLTK